MLDAEMFIARMDLRHRGVGIDRFEADAEFPDFCQIVRLGALADAAYAPDVGVIEYDPIMFDFEPVLEELEENFRRILVFGILQ